MKPALISALVIIGSLLSGCGDRLSGRYEMALSIPQMTMPGVDAKTQKQMAELTKSVEDMNRMSLEFDGSKVRMGSMSAITEHKYRLNGQRLEVIVEGMGQKAVLPMTVQTDGSINYMGLIYRKVR